MTFLRILDKRKNDTCSVRSHPGQSRHRVLSCVEIPAQQREMETLSLLTTDLPDTYTINHGLHWTRVNQGHTLVAV